MDDKTKDVKLELALARRLCRERAALLREVQAALVEAHEDILALQRRILVQETLIRSFANAE